MHKLKIIVFLINYLFLSAYLPSVLKAEITAQQIINRIQSINESITSRKMTMSSTMRIFSGQEIKTKTIISYKYPNNVKMETVEPDKQVIIMRGQIMSMKLSNGQVITKEIPSSIGQGIQPGMNFDFKEFLKNYRITLDSKKSDYNNSLYVINLVARVTNPMFYRLEMYIDYGKGVIYKTNIYSRNNNIIMTSENMEYRLFDKFWFPQKSEMTANSPMGNITTETVFEDIQINIGIPDSEFELK